MSTLPTVIPSALTTGLTPDPKLAPALRWGILGAGGIAGAFAAAVTQRTNATIAAIGSRDAARAQEFAANHLGDRASEAAIYGSYEDLVADASLDAIYVATPHSHHREHALMAIQAGKHVLVEKAFTRNVSEAQEVFDAAQTRGVFVMEAMWTRFLPHIAAVHDLIDRGEIGEILTLTADHGQYFPYDREFRLYNPELAGGAMLDLGVYPVAFAHDFLGVPESITSHGELTQDAVDGQVAMIFGFPNKAQALLHTTLWSRTPTVASIMGTKGRIDIAGSFYAPTSFEVVMYSGETSRYERDDILGLEFEAAEVARCVAAGLTQSPLMTWQHTLDVMTAMDQIRKQTGVVYAGE